MRITKVTLVKKHFRVLSEEAEREKTRAITDLEKKSDIALTSGLEGPFALELSIQQQKLQLAFTSESKHRTEKLKISLTPLRKVIKDYYVICESYFDAVKAAHTHQIEAIDMGRRGVHNEGADVIVSLCESQLTMDFETARRLFTLICVLHLR